MDQIDSYTVDIYVGLKEHYDGRQDSIEALLAFIQPICDEGLCVSIFPCHYIYKNGNEQGAMIRLINYPRFPSTPSAILAKAIDIATKLKRHFQQYRITVQDHSKAYLIEDKTEGN